MFWHETKSKRGIKAKRLWWLWVDLNHRPRHYECRATNQLSYIADMNYLKMDYYE